MVIGSSGSWYTSGSLYKKWSGSNGISMNRKTVANFDAQVAAAGSIIFGQAVSHSEGLSILAAQAFQQRVADEMQAKLASAEKARSSALNFLA